mmetsp:Transcript_104258/g.290418  ORF Transcript_104258/g.290418 Transcript_104258/m.290418 type:complete len:208 (+) Transcript_104258:356-979(+)
MASGAVPSCALCALPMVSFAAQCGMRPLCVEVTWSSEAANPGSTAMALMADFRSRSSSCRAMAKAEFASLVWWYRFHGPPALQPVISAKGPVSPPRLPASHLAKCSSFRSFAGRSRALELWKTTRASPLPAAAFSSWCITAFKSTTCEIWFVCIWTSKPSAVRLSGMAMMPALLASTSKPPRSAAMAETFCAHSLTEARLWRSQSTL